MYGFPDDANPLLQHLTYLVPQVLGPTPKAYLWALDNKIFACMMIFFCANLVETQLISTGAFEVSVKLISSSIF